MYLRIGGTLRPFVEADVEPSYQPFYDGQRRIYKTGVTMRVSGRIVQNESPTQAGMTALIQTLQQQLSAPRPDIVLLGDDGSTPSAISLYASNCVSGPEVRELTLPSNAGKLYLTSCPYSFTVYGEVTAGSGSTILEFMEAIQDAGTGGYEIVHVGGAINPPERQIGQQYTPYRYTQQGFAVGAFGYPVIPPPIWPGALKRPRPQVMYEGPQIIGPIPQNFRVSWSYEYESAYELFGIPHQL